MRVKISFVISIIFLLLLCLNNASCSPDKQIVDYANNYQEYLDKEVDTCNDFISDLEKADLKSEPGIKSFQIKLTTYVSTYNNYLDFYNTNYPNSSPQDLKDSVILAKNSAIETITAINSINIAIANHSPEQLSSALELYDSGTQKLNASISKFNTFRDSFNDKLTVTGPSLGFGILFGTATLWGLSFLIVNPLTRCFTKRELALKYANGNTSEDQSKIDESFSSVFNRTYMIVDSIVLGIAGFLLGLFVGWFFIGITWKARNWPGLIAMVALSILGAFLNGYFYL